MNSLKTYKFSDLYDFSSGISTKPEQAGHGQPFVSFSTVFNNYFLPDSLPDLMDASLREQERYSVKKGDIFLTRTSETVDELAMSCVVLKDYPKATYSGFLKRLRPLQKDITYHKFIGFYLRSKLFRQTMTNNAVMTLRASLNEQIFSYLELILPTFEEQVKVGDLLHLLNEKIALNNQINQKLEAMAKTLYNYWFIQFDFPDTNGKPYKSSGGKMVYSEELKREIPEGWEVQRLSDLLINISKSVTKEHLKPYEKYTPIDLFPMKKMSFNAYLPASEAKTSLIRYQYKDILVGAMRVYFHRVCIAPFDGITRTTSLVLRPKNPIYLPYLYQICNEERTINMATKLSSGTQQPYVKWEKNLENHQIPNNIDLVEKYSKRVSGLIDKVILQELQNQKLTQLRDWLLPMLMNGQLKVADAADLADELMVAEPLVGYGVKENQ